MTFREALQQQRWDDHRYYHHSRINQSLHLFSAVTFLGAYALLWAHPTLAVFLAWLVAMPSRQIGHFLFEPHGYDVANQATHEHKEEIKVGYNLSRKIVLLSVWAGAPLVLALEPTLFGLLPPRSGLAGFGTHVATLWFALAAAALIGRTVQLFFIRDVQTGLVWCAKILTDPFHDIALYRHAPRHLLRGELFDPIVDAEIVGQEGL